MTSPRSPRSPLSPRRLNFANDEAEQEGLGEYGYTGRGTRLGTGFGSGLGVNSGLNGGNYGTMGYQQTGLGEYPTARLGRYRGQGGVIPNIYADEQPEDMEDEEYPEEYGTHGAGGYGTGSYGTGSYGTHGAGGYGTHGTGGYGTGLFGADENIQGPAGSHGTVTSGAPGLRGYNASAYKRYSHRGEGVRGTMPGSPRRIWEAPGVRELKLLQSARHGGAY